MVHALNGNYSTESAHKRFLFTSYDASKKKRTSERSEVQKILLHRNQ